jgi:hypothetical protein
VCKVNTASFHPPKEYIFFKKIESMEDHIKKCALEASRKGYRNFGVADNICIPMSPHDYRKFMKTRDSTACYEGIGSFHGVTGYTFDKNVNMKNILNTNWKVRIYSEQDFKGSVTIADAGIHDLKYQFIIKSIKVPRGFNATLYNKKTNKNLSLFGPTEANINPKSGFTKLIVEYVFQKSVIICESNDGNKGCYSINAGKYAVNPNKYGKIKYVNVPDNVRKVTLYQDTNFLDLLQEFGPGKHEIDYPKIVRSVSVQ